MNGDGPAPRAPAARLRDEDFDRLAAMMGPLANPVRLRLLRYLTRPHYLEEIAAHLGLTRQAARKHLDKLVAIGAIEKQPGARERKSVTDYVTNPQALFIIHDQFEKLGSLLPRAGERHLVETLVRTSTDAPPRGPGGTFICIMRGMNSGTRFPLDKAGKDGWLIGRDKRSDIAIPHDPWVSNRHAEVRHVDEGYRLADLGSTNSTQYNWTRLPRAMEVQLHHGDVVGVGRTVLLFWDRG